MEYVEQKFSVYDNSSNRYPRFLGALNCLSLLVWINEMPLQGLPALGVVILLYLLTSLEAPFRHTYHKSTKPSISIPKISNSYAQRHTFQT